MVVSAYDRIERWCDVCDAEEFRTGPWLKRVKVTELIPLSTPAKHGGDSSYALLLNLSVTVPWLAERRSVSFESQPDSDDSGELDFDMEIFEREEDNRQVDSFLFEVDVKAYQPHHLAVAAGLLRGAVCILSREENSEKIDFRCPTLDRLQKQLKQLEEQRSNTRKRSKAIATAAWISTAVAALGIGSMVWGSTQPRRLRRTLDNSLPQLLEYQFRLSQQSALSDISRMASPSNMMKIWKARSRNPRAAIGGIAEGVGFWAFLSGLVASGAVFTRKMRTVNVENQANEKSRASLGQRIGSAAASAIERFRKGIASKLRVVFIVDETL
ncbi:putative transmembrane protein [Toxoplasma gondii GAB2-2007-GAL-DOM2]|uniref:Transmembrane protein n=6 Tax=Toxoplasma gondii TaxID=5811 RepID=S7UZ01_TOXGG|nr:hypothetical protein TGGT1_258462 [Toxoplasma gondii GT1]KAF4641352.1 hypothetical protein TGRH88_071620 [Toxoplasma gondii]KFG33816.1 putative transmembrane protein [Toxoplasma gondii GAB2-2007-GAL-DOM2]KFG38012.1 putative transmembrane protein [Toxoplasma gondii FOU]PUA84200.1 putative transmembrane protein [Toxoplasma gondii TgCATBr9]RQX71130.1 putative transmembrane protein [Toxoplasma gondii CAST]